MKENRTNVKEKDWLYVQEEFDKESINITYRYAHLFPSVQVNMADELNKLKGDK